MLQLYLTQIVLFPDVHLIFPLSSQSLGGAVMSTTLPEHIIFCNIGKSVFKVALLRTYIRMISLIKINESSQPSTVKEIVLRQN